MSVPPLRALVAAGFDVAMVITRIDKRRGRGSDLAPSPVKIAATELGLPVAHQVDDLLDASIDLGVVVAFGQIIRPHVLAQVPMVNLHFSLLPRWRGAAPVERALLAGDTTTGVCLMQLEEGLDTGPVYARREVPIGAATTADELRASLVAAGTELLIDSLRHGLGTPVPQTGEPTYASKITAADLRIDWRDAPQQVHRVVRLGGAWTTFRGKRLKVTEAELVGHEPGDSLHGDRVGGLRLLRVQPEGRADMAFADFARGARPQPGERMGT
jgi:methionyl-tRNA formyltransferase